jgi:16S rRNA (guanine527-N7)-methyltransferase
MGISDEQFSATIRAGLSSLPGVPTDNERVASLRVYLRELQRWNKAYNLTAVRDPVAMISRHIFDSLSVLPFMRGELVLDVGTGAGLPGIPLAICREGCRFVLIDSNGKKVRFLQHVIAELKLTNVEPVQARVESYQSADRFDSIVCRAYTSLRDFVHSSGDLLVDGGRLVAMKGKHPQAEMDDLPGGWRVAELSQVQVPDVAGDRHIVVLQRA